MCPRDTARRTLPRNFAENRYLLTCVDRFTRWPEAIPMVDIRAETVADAFFSGWIARYGTPATITTDRGAQFESKLWDSLCNQFRIIRNRTTSYHPQSNSMVERFHRQLKAAIMAHESPNTWTITLPAVLLGVRSAVKERLGRSAAEMIYGTTLRLPGEFTKQYTVDANTDLENYSDKLRVAMSRLRLCPPRDRQQHNIFQFKEIATCTHVFLRRIAIAPPLTAPYDGPYKVVARSGRVMKILVIGKVETVSLNPHILSASLRQVRQYSVKRQANHGDRRLPGHLVRIHRIHLDLVVRTLRRPTGRELKRKSRRQSEAVKNRPQSQSE